MRVVDLQELSTRKLRSAEALAHNKHWSNAYYLAGYAIEFALKAVAAKQISADTIPDKKFINDLHTHNFKTLVGLAGLKGELDDAIRADSTLGANWAICSEWSPEARYQEKSSAETTFLLMAISNKTRGVLPWIMKYW